ncbi:MAG: alpha-ribazole phosphatase [Anaerolineae bacterium]|jgi:alpha-ribazole phosphatase
MTRLLLARHGETAWNSARRYQGQTDVPLNEAGRHQANALAQRLSGEGLDAIYASDLLRALETATAIAAFHDAHIQADPRLREIAFGDWEGLTSEEIKEQNPGLLTAWHDDPLHASSPGGETLNQVAHRARAALAEITARNPDRTVLIVAHGGILRVLVCLALEVSPAAYWRFRFGLASLSEVSIRQTGATLNTLNDTSHLRTRSQKLPGAGG